MAENTDLEELRRGTDLVKRGFARMQKGGVIMDVVDPEQARIAEEAGAVAVMALEAVPADIRKRGGVARMADPADVARSSSRFRSRSWASPVSGTRRRPRSSKPSAWT